MTLDPQVQALIQEFKQYTPTELSVDEVRAIAKKIYKRKEIEVVAQVDEKTISVEGREIRVRVYRPEAEGPLPILVFFHGGGWVFGSLDSADGICRSMANKTQCVVVSVDYRLAPEHCFPAAAEDCYAAVKWAQEHAEELGGDAQRLVVGGDSAGGNLAAAVCLMARDRKEPKILCQLLMYPLIQPDFQSPSYQQYGKGFLFDSEQFAWCWDMYAPKTEDRNNPYLSPIHAEKFHDLPPAIIVTAEFDPLRYEGEEYAKKLREAEVPVIFKRFPGMIHGFLAWDEHLDNAKKAHIEIGDALKMLIHLEMNRPIENG